MICLSNPHPLAWTHGLRGALAVALVLLTHAAMADSRVDEELQALENEIARLETQREGLLESLNRMDLDRQRLRNELAALRTDLQETRKGLRNTRHSIEETRISLHAMKVRLSRSTAALYKAGPPRPERWLLETRDVGDAFRSYAYAAYLHRKESEELERFAALSGKLARQEQSLKTQIAALGSLERALTEKDRRLKNRQAQHRRFLEALAQSESVRTRLVGELEEAQARLGSLLLRKDIQVPLDEIVSIESFQGMLPWPVAGKVLLHYGAIEHRRFKTKVPHPGLTLAASEGTPVLAVFDGTVAYSGWLEGYGQTLILSHGGDFFSVYAHNREILFAEGALVHKGQTLAKAGSTGSLDGPRLYFEIRQGSRPLDPEDWLAPRP